jgi:hypothetical protein
MSAESDHSVLVLEQHFDPPSLVRMEMVLVGFEQLKSEASPTPLLLAACGEQVQPR